MKSSQKAEHVVPKRPKEHHADAIAAVIKFLPVFETAGFRFGEMKSPPGEMPYFDYSEPATAFMSALYDNGWVVDFDWSGWQEEAAKYVLNADRLRTASQDTIRKLVTTHVRKERFCEGHLNDMFDNGHLPALLRRLKEIGDDLVRPGESSNQNTNHGAPDIAALAEACRSKLGLDEVRLPSEYFYQSLPLCVIDSVFSLNVRYKSVQNVVERYCRCFGLTKFRAPGSEYPPQESQHSVRQFLSNAQVAGIQKLADEVFVNHTRTSPKNGILKAEAVVRFSEVLRDSGVDYFQDLGKIVGDAAFLERVRAIPGQGSGLTTNYLFMLAGDATLSKPDRHVIAFWEGLLGHRPSMDKTQAVMRDVVKQLTVTCPAMTVRTLDYAVWSHQRAS